MEHINANLLTPGELGLRLAARARALRLHNDLTRDTLALKAGVSSASLKRFENTGLASLELVLKVAFALGCMPEFAQLFAVPEAQTMSDLESGASRSRRQRGRR